MYSFCTHVDEVLGAAGGNPRGQSRSFELVLHYIVAPYIVENMLMCLMLDCYFSFLNSWSDRNLLKSSAATVEKNILIL